MKVVHVITGLGTGGAETFLLSLLRSLPSGISSEVISLSSIGPTGERLKALGVPVQALDMSGRPGLGKLLALRRLLRQAQPDVVQTWMHHADLLGGLAAASLGLPVVWNIRGEAFAPDTKSTFKRSTILVMRLCALASRFVPKVIVCCAASCSTSHRRVGYRTDRMVLIRNGVDTDRFANRPQAGARFRNDHGLESCYVVSMVGRVHPQKNQAGFIAAAEIVAEARADVKFVIAGPGVTATEGPVARLVDQSPHKSRFRLLDAQDDLAPLYTATDVLVCPSLTEAFPNVIAEAMACEAICVANDVGDASHIIGEVGVVSPGADPAQLAAGVLQVLALGEEERQRRKAEARRRMVEHFSFLAAVQRYAALYEQLVSAA